MNSDQKIGVALLIGLTGFAIAIGFGRKPAADAGRADVTELAAAGDAFAVPVHETAADPFAVAPSVEKPPAVGAVDDATAPAWPESRVAESLELPPPARRRPGAATPRPAGAEVSSPVVRTPTPAEQPTPIGRRTVVVQAGDTLSAIAARELGSASRYYQLFEANADTLSHPNDLRIGQTLRIPEIQQAAGY